MKRKRINPEELKNLNADELKMEDLEQVGEITIEDILSYFPINDPFRFIDEILEIDATHILGKCTFPKESSFYEGHFPGAPITPGSILQESGAQIGLVAFGMYLLGNRIDSISDVTDDFLPPELEKLPGIKAGPFVIKFYLTSAEMKFKKVIQPGQSIYVYSEKVFFRLNKLKCNVTIKNEEDEIVCRGVMSGMVNIVKGKESLAQKKKHKA